jgi:hypothetical protein
MRHDNYLFGYEEVFLFPDQNQIEQKLKNKSEEVK